MLVIPAGTSQAESGGGGTGVAAAVARGTHSVETEVTERAVVGTGILEP